MLNTVFVSGYVSRDNIYEHCKTEDYINYGKKLLALNIFQVIFIEKEIFQTYLNEYNSTINTFSYESNPFEYLLKNNKIFVFFEKEDNYLYKYKDELIHFQVNTDNPKKDTKEYMFIQCHKTEWVKMSIVLLSQVNLLQDQEFIWLDFGIYHIINNDELLNKAIKKMTNKHDKVRIGSCWNLNECYRKDLYTEVIWYFCGGVFGGNTESIIKFANLMKKKCLDMIKEKRITWEVNIWYMIYQENKELFDSYFCVHNISILENY